VEATVTSIPEHARQAGTPAASTRNDWKNTVLAGLANYIDAGSIVAGSVALAIWAKQFHLTSNFLGPIGAFSSNAISAGIGAARSATSGWAGDIMVFARTACANADSVITAVHRVSARN
jgi:hypothetical protein